MGETSAFMTEWCLKNLSEEYDMVVCMANTGEENEKSLEFAKKCEDYFGWDIVWLECVTNPVHGEGVSHKIVNFESASRKGEPFEAMIAKHGIPNKKFPHCNRELKLCTIQSYLRSIGWADYYTAVGVRIDEPGRLNWKSAAENKIIYPLATHIRKTKVDINIYWSLMPFRLELTGWEGNCKWCWKKSLRKLLTIAKNHPEHYDFPKRMEEKYGNYVPETRSQNFTLPIRFFRDNMSVDEIMEDSKFPFHEAPDENSRTERQITLWDEYMDSNSGCVESCEAF